MEILKIPKLKNSNQLAALVSAIAGGRTNGLSIHAELDLVVSKMAARDALYKDHHYDAYADLLHMQHKQDDENHESTNCTIQDFNYGSYGIWTLQEANRTDVQTKGIKDDMSNLFRNDTDATS